METTWSNMHRPFAAPRHKAEVSLPQPQPFSAPVFIGDCTTPLAGETVLSLLWKRLDRDQSSE